MAENEDAASIYWMVQDQIIMGMGGAVALNQMAVHEVMRLYEIENPQDTFEKVVAVGRHMIAKQNEQAKNKAGSK
jgi:hypothetical protein